MIAGAILFSILGVAMVIGLSSLAYYEIKHWND